MSLATEKVMTLFMIPGRDGNPRVYLDTHTCLLAFALLFYSAALLPLCVCLEIVSGQRFMLGSDVGRVGGWDQVCIKSLVQVLDHLTPVVTTRAGAESARN